MNHVNGDSRSRVATRATTTWRHSSPLSKAGQYATSTSSSRRQSQSQSHQSHNTKMKDPENPMMDQRVEGNLGPKRVQASREHSQPLHKIDIEAPPDEPHVITETFEAEFKYDVRKEFSRDAKDLVGKGKHQNAHVGRMKKDHTQMEEPFLDVEAPGG